MKKVFAFFVAVVMILPLCGCTAEPLTAEEYKTEVLNVHQKYSKYFYDYSTFVVLNVNNDDVGEQVNNLQANKEVLGRMVSNIELILDEFDNIGNPPKEYDKLHERLKKAISSERKWAKNQHEIHSASSVEDFNAMVEKTNKSYKDDEESLTSVVIDIMSAAV